MHKEFMCLIVLFRIDYIDVTPYTPDSIALLNGELLVGHDSNGIIRIKNKNVTQTVSSLCLTDDWISSILIYQNQYILHTCYSDKRIQIYNLNLISTGKYLNTSGNPRSIYSDDGNRLLVASYNPGGLDFFN